MVPSKRMFKFGAATFAATVGVILAITSAGAHSTAVTQSKAAAPSSHLTVLTRILSTAEFAGSPKAVSDAASSELLAEQDQDAAEAAELAAKIAAEQAELAAKLAAEKAEEAAEAAASTCIAGDQTEDTSERTADQTEDTAEKTNGTESDSEDSAEMAARQATDKPEDASEVPCAGAEEHHSDGDNHEGSSTFSFEGDH